MTTNNQSLDQFAYANELQVVNTKDGKALIGFDSWEQAEQIADEKLAYQDECIAEVEERQQKRYSLQRSKLISKMKRENPLRRIVDADHAYAILSASRRHNNTNYDSLLEEYRDEARIGNIDHVDVRELARQNYR